MQFHGHDPAATGGVIEAGDGGGGQFGEIEGSAAALLVLRGQTETRVFLQPIHGAGQQGQD
jgi:hypothetical protein